MGFHKIYQLRVNCQGPDDTARRVQRCPEVAEINAIIAPNSDVLIEVQFFPVCDFPCGEVCLYRYIKAGPLRIPGGCFTQLSVWIIQVDRVQESGPVRVTH